MEEEEKGSTSNSTETEGEIDSSVVNQYKIIMIICVIALIGFLLFFVYNLIKCYLPKWMNRREELHEEKKEGSDNNNASIGEVKIEFVDTNGK